MSKKNSEELKQQIVNELINGIKTIAQLAKEHGCSEQSIRNWANKKITNTSVSDKTSSQLGVDIPANRVPVLALYSLEEASKLAKITVEQLLYYAVRGDIKVYIYNAKNHVFTDGVGISEGWRKPGSVLYSVSSNKDIHEPYLLNISEKDCEKLMELRTDIEINQIPLILLKNGDKFLVKKPRQANNIGFDNYFNSWDSSEKYNFFYPIYIRKNDLVYTEDNSKTITISMTNVRFLLEELNKFIGEAISLIPAKGQMIEPFSTDINKSSLLVDLDAAAFEMYGTYNPIKVAHYDTTEKISTYLMRRFDFFKIHADVAAEVILPSSDNPIKEDSQGKYRTRLLQLLIHAWSELCRNKEFKRDDETRYDRDADSWFKEKFKHKLSLAIKNRKILAKIILPDNAPFHNPRRAKK